MKRNILVAVMICFVTATGIAQGITDKEMTFFGIDFSTHVMNHLSI